MFFLSHFSYQLLSPRPSWILLNHPLTRAQAVRLVRHQDEGPVVLAQEAWGVRHKDLLLMEEVEVGGKVEVLHHQQWKKNISLVCWSVKFAAQNIWRENCTDSKSNVTPRDQPWHLLLPQPSTRSPRWANSWWKRFLLFVGSDGLEALTLEQLVFSDGIYTNFPVFKILRFKVVTAEAVNDTCQVVWWGCHPPPPPPRPTKPAYHIRLSREGLGPDVAGWVGAPALVSF